MYRHVSIPSNSTERRSLIANPASVLCSCWWPLYCPESPSVVVQRQRLQMLGIFMNHCKLVIGKYYETKEMRSYLTLKWTHKTMFPFHVLIVCGAGRKLQSQ